MGLPALVDNNRVTLSEVINETAPKFTHLSIATGYWDLPGTLEILDSIENYQSIRLVIGLEPISSRNQAFVNLNLEDDNQFPDSDIEIDLIEQSKDKNTALLRDAAKRLKNLIKSGVLEVKVFKKPRLHAKAYIFNNLDVTDGVGIVGSSNFTKAGLTANSELNAIEEDIRIIDFRPSHPNQGNGHLSWFNSIWNDKEAQDWTGEFNKIIESSPVGDLTFGPYEIYIKTLMEIYEDELKLPEELGKDLQDVLYDFQNRNAGILINKLNRIGLAMLADSVGLGKTITAGAVIKHYLTLDERTNVLVIAPAALKQQWIDDLSRVLDIEKNEGAFDIVSQQDVNALRKIIDHYNKEWRKTKFIDLIVIDEAHNLRSQSGIRHEVTLDLLQQHPDAKVLLLTATPINNSLLDIANQIQLGSKGKRNSVTVTYTRPNGKEKERIDFFVALDRIQKSIKKAQKRNQNVVSILTNAKETIHEGLRHYLVRSTRQGVEAEGGIVSKEGHKTSFPVSIVNSINYQYQDNLENLVFESFEKLVDSTFEGIDTRYLNLLTLSNFTQQTSHPLDFLKVAPSLNKEDLNRRFGNKVANSDNDLVMSKPVKNLIHNFLQSIYLLGFTPYRINVYLHEYYNKSIEEINSIENQPPNLKIQMAVHNILQINWLKRLESSSSALLQSIKNYQKRLDLFEKYLDRGFLVSLSDIDTLESEYGEDLDLAFSDYEDYLNQINQLAESGSDKDIKSFGIEKRVADPKKYNLEALRKDLDRDKRIISSVQKLLEEVVRPEHDPKLHAFKDYIANHLGKEHGKKVLVFSFFTDTIDYLQKHLPGMMHKVNPGFEKESAFLHGQSNSVENLVGRFSPNSKKYSIKPNEQEINFLFSTDILSEGQNLQDAGILINYDLHWNPVRMIQRNGRINRLGSAYDSVLIGNMRPSSHLDLYLKLVNRLENKIQTIKYSVGLDQGVLHGDDVNPINFIENYYERGELPEIDDDLLAHVDKHIVALRQFIVKYKNNPRYVDSIKNIPPGKWNYLSKSSNYKHGTIALMKTKSEALESKTSIDNSMFFEIDTHSDEYVTAYVDYAKALDYIEAKPEDNSRLTDNIQVDRYRVFRRANAEARRQASNPETEYNLTPSMEKAVIYMLGHMEKETDVRRIIQQGITDIRIEKRLEKNLRKVLKETKEKGTQLPNTIREFKEIIHLAEKNISEEKVIKSVEGILYYVEQ